MLCGGNPGPSEADKRAHQDGETDEADNRPNPQNVIMDYYKNNDKSLGSVDDNSTRHLKIFMDLCLEYPVNDKNSLRHFSHSIMDTSQAYHYYVL